MTEQIALQDWDGDYDEHHPEIMAEATELAALVLPELGYHPDIGEIALCAALGAAYAVRELADDDSRPPIIPPDDIPWIKGLARKVGLIVLEYYQRRAGYSDLYIRARRHHAAIRCFLINLFPLKNYGEWEKEVESLVTEDFTD